VQAPRTARVSAHRAKKRCVKVAMKTAESDRLYALYLMALSTGMRQGELLSLRWTDIDLDRASLSVMVNLQRPRTGLNMTAKPKTRGSRRRIALTDQAVTSLREHRARQLEERLKLGELWTDQGLVFPNLHGGPYRANNLEIGNFGPLIHAAGMPPIQFHDLRHSCATILLLAGINPKGVSEMLGHSSVAITLDLFSHVLPDMQTQAAGGATEAALWG
jgi:integrase